MRRDGFTSSRMAPRVRLWNWPVPTWVTQTSVGPSRSERNATKPPSREMAAACSVPSKSVRWVNRASANGLRRAASVPATNHTAAPSPARIPQARASQANRRRPDGAGWAAETTGGTWLGCPRSASLSTDASPPAGLWLRLLDHASSSARDAKTEPSLSWICRWTGIPSRFSQRWTVLTSRLRCAAMSFHESSRSSGGFPREGAAESGLGGSATLASGWRQDWERSKPRKF